MEENKKITEVPIAQTFPDGYVLTVIGGSIKRVSKSLISSSSSGMCNEIFVEAQAPETGYSYTVEDSRLSLSENTSFFVLFPDDNAPTRANVSLSVNGIECVLYWKGQNISMMASTLGHVFTHTNGYVHFKYMNNALHLIGVDTISSGNRLYTAPNDYVKNTWYES